MLHFCLAGPDLTGQHALIEHLRKRHVVTLVREASWLQRQSLISDSDALALEADEVEDRWRSQLEALRTLAPALPIVLVDGDLTDEEKADAFALGALDFFPAPCQAHLLAERLEVLANAGRRLERMGGPGSINSSAVDIT